MNLPVLNKLELNQCNYITFSKALLDYDVAITENKPYVFSKMVAINLPSYVNPDFYIDLTSVGISNDNIHGPNYFIPKGFQFYLENIIRQKTDSNYITELAFYKFLNKCGMSYSDIHNSIVFINNINTENFTYVENNNGWGEIVMQIPNNSKLINKVFKSVELDDLILADTINGNTDGIFDDMTDKSFDFSVNESKQVIDFDSITYDENTNAQFDFNALMVFYKDENGIEKLHGINFLNTYENKITEWELPSLSQMSNDSRSMGFLFKMNVKTVNNEASLIMINEYNNAAHWNTYFDTFTNFNTFLQAHKSHLNPNTLLQQ